MTQKSAPPYYANPDGTLCLQCSLRMGLEHFKPSRKWTWEELCELTGKDPGLHSWPPRTYAELQDSEYETVIYDCIDYSAFSLNPEQYLRSKFSPAYAEESIKYTNIPSVLKDIQRFMSNEDIQIHCKSYNEQDVKRLIKDGYMIVAWLDHAKIWNLADQCNPHYVLVYDCDDKGVLMHDSGGDENTRQPALHVSWDNFFTANKMNKEDETGEMFAFKPKQTR